MTSRKTLGKKKRLANALNTNRAVPLWVVVKTLAKVKRRPKPRNWRRNKIKA